DDLAVPEDAQGEPGGIGPVPCGEESIDLGGALRVRRALRPGRAGGNNRPAEDRRLEVTHGTAHFEAGTHPTPRSFASYSAASIAITTRASTPDPRRRHSRRTPSQTNPSASYRSRARVLKSLTSSQSRWAFRSRKAKRWTARTAAFPNPRPLAVTTTRRNSRL